MDYYTNIYNYNRNNNGVNLSSAFIILYKAWFEPSRNTVTKLDSYMCAFWPQVDSVRYIS